jgi:hypothetical protein
MGVVASCFYRIVHDAFLEHLIRSVWKSKKLMDDQNARRLMGIKKKKRTHGEMLRRAL